MLNYIEYLIKKERELFLLILITVTAIFYFFFNSFILDKYIKKVESNSIVANPISFILNKSERNLITQSVNIDNTNLPEFDILDYDDLIKSHRLLDHSNPNLVIINLPKTSETKHESHLEIPSPIYPPIVKVIRFKNLLI